MDFCKIYNEKKLFLENSPIDGNISMEIGILEKFPWIHGVMPRGGKSGKNWSNIQWSQWSRG
jgi:hypothetical protein